mmetsp:Transcript_22160/g.69331  ORF Transcript_22160/g.69331 Transcript_22160/m.69331 type:complete len:229 (-) Transcript_22160:497-1183(-)
MSDSSEVLALRSHPTRTTETPTATSADANASVPLALVATIGFSPSVRAQCRATWAATVVLPVPVGPVTKEQARVHAARTACFCEAVRSSRPARSASTAALTSRVGAGAGAGEGGRWRMARTASLMSVTLPSATSAMTFSSQVWRRRRVSSVPLATSAAPYSRTTTTFSGHSRILRGVSSMTSVLVASKGPSVLATPKSAFHNLSRLRTVSQALRRAPTSVSGALNSLA